MTTDKLDLLGPALSRIGQEVMRIVGGEPNGIYVYVEAGDGWVGPSIFKDEGDSVRYIDDNRRDLSRAIMNAWRLEPEDKRWTGMEYTIDGGKFNARFQFDDLTAYDGSIDRSERFLHARYGDKPIVYPPLKASATELKPSS